MGRSVAVKVLSEAMASDSRFRESFERQLVDVASLHHPNIVSVYDAGAPKAPSGRTAPLDASHPGVGAVQVAPVEVQRVG